MSTVSACERIRLPASAPGNERHLLVHRFGRPGARPKAYVQASLHADEIPALLVAHHLRARLDACARDGALTGEVVVVPYANPIGLDQALHGHTHGRYAFDGTGNFNRGFPDVTEAARERLTGSLGGDPQANVEAVRAALLEAARALARERETDALKATLLELALDADLVFDLHCAGESLVHVYASYRHRELGVELGAELGARAILLEDRPGGATFQETVAEPWWRLAETLETGTPLPRACFATTVELRGQADVEDVLAGEDAAAIVRFLMRCGVVAGDPGPLAPPQCEPTPLEGADELRAPATGVLVYRRALGEPVARGELIAEVVDPAAEDPSRARTPVVSRASGLLLDRRADRLVRRGERIGTVAGREPLAHRRPGALLED